MTAGRYIRLPAACWNARGDVFAKHRYDGAQTCSRCGHPITAKAAAERAKKQRRTARRKAQAA